MIAIEPLKLNLGSRNRTLPGFKNMDCDKHENVDYVGDVSSLLMFQDNSIKEIYASHILEHFPHVKSLDVLKEWCRVLEVGGILYVAVPDFRRTIELYCKTQVLNDWMVNFLWGDQGYPTAFHYSGFDKKRLTDLLKEAGFSEVSQVEFFPQGINTKDCSTLVSHYDQKPISLNIIAVK